MRCPSTAEVRFELIALGWIGVLIDQNKGGFAFPEITHWDVSSLQDIFSLGFHGGEHTLYLRR